MLRKKRIKHQFVYSVPATLQEGVLYVCLKHNIVSHLCACGCGHRIDTPLDPSEWTLTYDGKTVSLNPSIGNWDLPCHTHYFITRGIVCPVPEKKKRKKWFFF